MLLSERETRSLFLCVFCGMSTTAPAPQNTTVHILDRNGRRRFSTPINIGSKRTYKLMGDDFIMLKFSVAGPIYFELGDWCEITDEYFGLCRGRYELTSPCQPTYNEATGGYDYELRLDAQYIKWKNKLMKFMPMAGGGECSWSVVADAKTHLSLIVDNINALADPKEGGGYGNPSYLYNGIYNWQAARPDNSVIGGAKDISYESTSIYDALSSLAETFECEWWVSGNMIFLGKCINGGENIDDNAYVDVELGVNAAAMSRSDSSEKYVTRIYPFGGERNIPATYRKDLIFEVTDVENGGNLINDRYRRLDFRWFDGEDDFKVTFPTNCPNPEKHKNNPNLHCQWESVTGLIVQSLDSKGEVMETYRDCTLIPPVKDAKNDDASAPKSKSAARALTAEEQRYADIGFKLIHDGRLPSSYNTLDDQFYDWRKDDTNPYYRTLSNPDHEDYDWCYDPESGHYESRMDKMYGEFYNAEYDPTSDINNHHAIAAGDPEDADDSAKEIDIYAAFIRLSNGGSFEVGQKYIISNIARRKVKSSYFSDRASAYDEFASVVKNSTVTKRLMLPESGLPYVDLKPGQNAENSVEDVVVFDDVYPHALSRVTAVATLTKQREIANSDGKKSYEDYTVYRIKDNIFSDQYAFDTATNTNVLVSKGKEFKNIYKNPNGEPLHAWFQDVERYEKGDNIPEGKFVGDPTANVSLDDNGMPVGGKLNGWDFDIEFIGNQPDANGFTWEIICKGDVLMPNETMPPCVGDTFIITNYDISMVDEVLVEKAEKKLAATAADYVKKLNEDPSTYECTMMCDADEQTSRMSLGTPVNLINPAYIQTVSVVGGDGSVRKWGRKSRVIGYDLNLDIPYDNPVFTIGEKPQYSRFGEIEDNIDAIRYAVNNNKYANSDSGNGGGNGNIGSSTGNTGGTQQGGSANLPIIHLYDSQPWSDYNVFSALRSKHEFALKQKDDTIVGLWNFPNGTTFGTYKGGVPKASVDGDGNARVNALNVSGHSALQSAKFNGNVDFGNFTAGVSGGGIWTDESGNVHIETDYIQARKKIQAREVEIQEMTHVGGCQIVSPAAMRCTRVSKILSNGDIRGYVCYFNASDGDGISVSNTFAVGDLARCETFNLQSNADGTISNRYYWRKVKGVGTSPVRGEHYIYLSNLDGEKDINSDAPQPGDRIVTVGNCDPDKSERSNLIVISAYGSGSPYIYQFKGITTFKLGDENLKTKLAPDGNRFTGKFVIENGSESTNIEDIVEQYRMSLTNEFLLVECDAAGVVSGTLPTTQIQTWHGNEPSNGWAFKLKCTNCNAIVTVGDQTILEVTEVSADNAAINITATKNNCPDLTKVVTIYKVKQGITGERGENALQFEIEPSNDVVTVDVEGTAVSPPTISCKVFIIDGNNKRVEVKIRPPRPAAENVAQGGENGGDVSKQNVRAIAGGGAVLAIGGAPITAVSGLSVIPRNIKLTYVIARQVRQADNSLKTEIGAECAYYGDDVELPIDMQYIAFKLYRDNDVIAVRSVNVMVDTKQMNAVYTSKFEATKRDISAMVSSVTDTNNKLSELKIQADGISTNVSSLKTETNDRIESVINQTADQISLKVSEIKGYTNLITGHVSGIGWTMPGNAAPTPTDGVFSLNASNNGENWLRTPVFNVEPNTDYTISFKHRTQMEGNRIGSVKLRVGMHGQSTYFKQIFIPESFTSATFTVPDVASPSIFVEFHISAGVESWISLSVWNVQVERGTGAHPFTNGDGGLLGTGIDIANKCITLTSDNIQVKNNEGKTTLLIDDKGKLQADLIDADNIHTNRLVAGDDNGQRVSILPEKKRVEIYGSDNILCTIMDGNKYSGGADDLFNTAQKQQLDSIVSENTDFSFGNGKINKTIEYKKGIDGLATHTISDLTLYSKAIKCDYPCEVSFTGGEIKCTLKTGGFHYNPEYGYYSEDINIPEYSGDNKWYPIDLQSHQNDEHPLDTEFAFCSVKIYAVVETSAYPPFPASGMQKEEIELANWLLTSDYIGNNTHDSAGTHFTSKSSAYTLSLKDTTIKTRQCGYIRAALKIKIDARMWGSGVEMKWNAYASLVPGLNTSNYFSNGFCIGSHHDQYISMHMDDAANLQLAAQYRGQGTRIRNGLLQTQSSYSQWRNAPMNVWSALVTLSQTLPNGLIASVKENDFLSYDGDSPLLVRSGVDNSVKASKPPLYPTPPYKGLIDASDAETGPSSKEVTIKFTGNVYEIKIPFPEKWKELNLAPYNTEIHLTPFGSVNVMASVVSINRNGITLCVLNCNTFAISITKI